MLVCAPTNSSLQISPNARAGVSRDRSAPSGLNTRAKRLGLIAGYRAPPKPRPPIPAPVRHIEATHPGELVQLDCFYVGKLAGSRGAPGRTPPLMWQDRCGDLGARNQSQALAAFDWPDVQDSMRELEEDPGPVIEAAAVQAESHFKGRDLNNVWDCAALFAPDVASGGRVQGRPVRAL